MIVALKRMIRGGCLVLALLCQVKTVLAQHTVSGFATDKEDGLPGAVVRLTPGTLGMVTDSAGKFLLTNVPDGSYDLHIVYVGYTEFIQHFSTGKKAEVELGKLSLKSNLNELGGVEISGKANKGSAVDAILLTKNSTRLVTVLSAEGIKKMPDKNVAEAVQRVAGIKMERNKGEGSNVSLRGTPADWTATFINGDRLPTADEDDPSRTFQFLVFPANLVDNIFVTRTVTPDMEGDNIGGAINFQTVSPTFRKRFSINVGAGANIRADKPLYDLNATYGNVSKNNKFSYVLSGSFYNRAYATDAQRIVYGSNYNHAINALELKDYFGSRTTIGGNAAVQYKATSRLTLGAHFMHGRMDDDKWQYKTTYNWSDGSGQRIRNIGTHGLLQRRLYGGDLTAEYRINDRMTIDAKVASYYSSFNYGHFPNGKDDPSNGYVTYKFINNDLLQYSDLVTTDFNGKIPTDPNEPTYPFKLIGADNPYGTGESYSSIQPLPNYMPTLSQYSLESVYSEVNHTHERDPIASQLNFRWKVNEKIKIKAGGKLRFKEGSREITRFDWRLNTANINGLVIPLDGKELQDAPRNSSFLSAQGDAYRGKVLPFMTKGQMSSFIQNLGDTLTPVPMDKYNPDYQYWVGSKYNYTETASAGYVMAEVNAGPRWKIVGGLRIENTHFTQTSDSLNKETTIYDTTRGVVYYDPVSLTVNRSYLAILPSINATRSIGESSDLRLAVSRTYHRPNFEETKPGFAVVHFEDLVFNFGNPDLKPTYSLNFDATYEHFFGNKGLATFGVYYKNVTDHIFTRVAADADPNSGILYKYYENAGTSYIMGAEASIDKQFDFLPGFWSGFGINANITASYSRMTVPGRPTSQALTEQTPLLYNIALYYDKNRVSIRAGLNYTGAYLKELNLAAVDGIGLLHKDTDFDFFADKLVSLDFQTTVKVSKHFGVYVEANNLLNAPYKTYFGQSWRTYRVEYYGPRLQAGAKFDL